MEQLSEFIAVSFSLINLPYTLLLCVTVLYWLSVIIGAMDIHVFDADADLNMDAHADVHADVDGDGHANVHGDIHADGHAPGGLQAFLHYFNVGDVPLTILLSFLFVPMWAMGLLGNYYLNPLNSSLLGLLIFIPNLLVSLHVAKFCTLPFKALFRRLDSEGERHHDLIGKTCIITTPVADAKSGQAEVKTKGAPLLLAVRTGGEELKKGDEAVLLESRDGESVYIVSKLELEK